MLIDRKTVRIARSAVSDTHRTFHSVVGQKVTHKPGYDDGVATTILARLKQIDESIAALATKIATLSKRRSRRNPTAWQLHASKILKAGGSIHQAAETWLQAKAENRTAEVQRS